MKLFQACNHYATAGHPSNVSNRPHYLRDQQTKNLCNFIITVEFLTSSQILWISLFTKYPIIQQYIEQATENMRVIWIWSKCKKKIKNQIQLCNLCLGLIMFSSLQISPPKPCIHYFSLYICHIPLQSHPNNIWWAAQIIKLIIMHLLQSPVSSTLLGSNIALSTLLWNTLS
jgi:hypothetical protein